METSSELSVRYGGTGNWAESETAAGRRLDGTIRLAVGQDQGEDEQEQESNGSGQPVGSRQILEDRGPYGPCSFPNTTVRRGEIMR